MTQLEVAYRYGAVPGDAELRALGSVREVYGIRRMRFDPKERIVRVVADVKAGEADVAKLEAYNYDTIINQVKSFYQPLIDAFNSEVAKANSM